MPQLKSDLLFMRTSAIEAEAISFNSPTAFQNLTDLVAGATPHTQVFQLFQGDTELARKAIARFAVRADPITGSCQMRLASYHYDPVSGQAVFDYNWPVVNSIPNHLGNCAVDVTTKLNSILTQIPVSADYFVVMVQLKGIGKLFAARLEMQ